MSRFHWQFENRDEYEKGREDERWRHPDYDHNKYSGDDKDRAYFEGREDYKREQEERRDEERREEEAAEHRHQEALRAEREAEEAYYYEQQQAEQEAPIPDEQLKAQP